MAQIRNAKTPSLSMAYEEGGPNKGEILILLHGWPDSPRTWDKVLPVLHEAGYQTIVPYLRGYGLSRFRPWLGQNPRRTGQPVAFAQDMIDLVDRLVEAFSARRPGLGCNHGICVGSPLSTSPEIPGYDLSPIPARRPAAFLSASSRFLVPMAALQ